MKKKELKKLAERFANLELLTTSDDPDKAQRAKDEIFTLSGRLDPTDMFEIDALVQEILTKNS